MAALAGAVGLAGCAGPSYAVRTYAERKPVPIRLGSDAYVVLDRPDLGRLLVSGDGDTQTEPSRARAQSVANRYLTEGGRGACTFGDGSTAAKPFVELTYRCEKAKPQAAAARASTPAPAAAATTGSTPSAGPRAAPETPPFALRMNRL